MGIKSAPEIFQKIMRQHFEDLDDFSEVIMDDILIWGKDADDLKRNVRMVLDRAI